MAFKQVGSLFPQGAPVLRQVIIANSVASVAMDSLKIASGFAALGTTGALVFGHLMSHVNERGVGLETTGVSGAQTGSYVGAYTAASDNQTVAKVKAVCDISKFTLYSVGVDDTLGSTTGSNLNGYNMDLADEEKLDESSSAATTAQYHSHGLDPNDATKVIVNIFESQVFGA